MSTISEIILNGYKYSLLDPIHTGGEGHVFIIDKQTLAKIYHAICLNTNKRLKVLALCNSYANNLAIFGNYNFAFPQYPVYETDEILDYICGFSMQYFNDCSKIEELGFDLRINDFKENNGNKLSESRAFDLVYQIFELVEKLHNSRIVLGDVNSGNLFFHSKSFDPVFIDLDSVQIGQFNCVVFTPEYIDPLIESQGKNLQGGYIYNTESDIFSFTCLCYELLVGVHPYFIKTDKNMEIKDYRQAGISFLNFFDSNLSIYKGIRYLDSPVNRNIANRLNQIKAVHSKIYDFFVSIFVLNNRRSILHSLERSDPRHPTYVFYTQSGFDNVLSDILKKKQARQIANKISLIPNSGFDNVLFKTIKVKKSMIKRDKDSKTNDPTEFKMFINNYVSKINTIYLQKS